MRKYLLIFFSLVLITCSRPPKKQGYSKHARGYHYRLWTFDEKQQVLQGQHLLIDAVFYTQNDSAFWDSANNLGGVYVITADSSEKANLLQYHSSYSSPGDSVSLLIPSALFFKQFFASEGLPYFSLKDTVVKLNFKLKKVLTHKEEVDLENEGQIRENRSIAAYFKSEQHYETARDKKGFFWLQMPDTSGGGLSPGTAIKVTYRASFLSGRELDPFEQIISFQYGVPDQVLPGLNYVMSYLKVGQNAKIILPSRLAFGEFGSSNGIVPPFTPLVYDIRIMAE